MSAYLVVIAKATPFHYNTIQEKQEGTVLHVVHEPSWFGQVLPNMNQLKEANSLHSSLKAEKKIQIWLNKSGL